MKFVAKQCHEKWLIISNGAAAMTNQGKTRRTWMIVRTFAASVGWSLYSVDEAQ